MKVYLAGPMNGIPEFNHPAFHRAEAWLVEQGIEVLSPARDNEIYKHEGSNYETATDTIEAHAAYLRRDMLMLLDAEGIVLMRGWQASSGANIELCVARALNLPVWDLQELTAGFKLRPTTVIPTKKLYETMEARSDYIMGKFR